MPTARPTLVARTQSLAAALGIKRYLGACKHHGQVWRWTSNGSCGKCTLEQATKWRKENGNKQKLNRARKDWAKKNTVKSLLQSCRKSAKKRGLEYNLKPGDIVIPERCPILGIPLLRGSVNSPNNPSIDRVDPSVGYVKSNVRVISYRANRLKSDASIEELKALVAYVEKHTNEV